MKKLKDKLVAEELEETSSSLSHLKKRNPKKYEILRLGTYLYIERISEDELINILNLYKDIKRNVSEGLQVAYEL